MHYKILEENKTVLKKRQAYYKLYLFGHRSEGSKISSSPFPLSCSHHRFPLSIPGCFSPSLWLSSVSPVSLPELKPLFIPLLWCNSCIFLSNPTLSFPLLWTEQTQIKLLVPDALSERCFSYKYILASAESWSKDVARHTKGRPEGTAVCLANGTGKFSYLCQGFFFDNCLAVLSDLWKMLFLRQNIFSCCSHPRRER